LLTDSTAVVTPALNEGAALVLLILLSVVIFLIGLSSEQIASLRFEGRSS
jgi:hypothetical protein